MNLYQNSFISFAMDAQSCLLIAIALLSVGVLASPKPSISATLLLFESILINIMLYMTFGLTIPIFGTSLLLTFFSMISIGANYYFEITNKAAASKPPKINIIIGVLLLIITINSIYNFSPPKKYNDIFEDMLLHNDSSSIITVGYALFSVLVCALTVLSVKNLKPGK